jgi:aldose sugar dehydrogenase
MRRQIGVAALVLVACTGSVSNQAGAQSTGVETRPPNAADQKPAFEGQTRAPEQKLNVAFTAVDLSTNALQIPWGMAFLPDGRMLVTERPGRLRIITATGQLSAPVTGLPEVDFRGQGGLLDVALDPNYATNQLIYWSFSEPRGEKMNATAVARGRLVDDKAAPRLEDVRVIYQQNPPLASQQHFGSRLVFRRDGTLLVTQGDRSITEGRMQAQNMDSGIGKIVRINTDGTIPKDNPFVGKQGARPEIWSIGHRNVQGAALHPTTGELWEVEHGTRGGDELNVARSGRDYGWPTIAYGIEYKGGPITGGIQQQTGMEQPVYYWDPVIAPGGMLFYTGKLFPAWQNSLFIGGLASTHLVRLSLKGERVVGEERLLTELQPQRERIRDVEQGPDGAIYVLTERQKATPEMPGGRLIKLVPGK